MPRHHPPHDDWRRDARNRDVRDRHMRDRDDFGQADYSDDYAYDPQTRTGYRAEERMERPDDYGQADYSRDWAYDPDRGAGRRRYEDDDHATQARYPEDRERYREGRDDDRDEPRSWLDRAGDALTGRSARDDRPQRRRGPSDRVLWAVIVQRLEDERGLDLHDVEVRVDHAEVTLDGTVRRKDDKRRIEDIADIDGVRHVQNNLRVRDRGRWTFR